MALRIDISKLSGPVLDQNGYLRADSYATRTGVFVYHHPDGTVTRELRHPDEVFKPDSMASLASRPIVDEHPKNGRLDANNTRHLAVGWSGEEPKQDGNYLKTKLLVTDQGAIDKIMDKEVPKRELSCGYNADIVKEDGEYKGERYDHKQTNIVYNHIALVRRGRAGREARIHLDVEDAVSDEIGKEIFDNSQKPDNDPETTGQSSTRKDTMTIKIKRPAVNTKTFKQDAMEISISEDGEKSVQQVLTILDVAIETIHKLEADNDKLQGRCDELKQASEMPPDKLEALVKERADLCGVAEHVGVSGYDKLDNVEIKKAIVQNANKDSKLDDVSEGYIDGRYDEIVNRIREDNKGLESLANLKKVTQKQATDSDDNKGDDEKTPREKYCEDTADMWKGDKDKAA